MGSSPKTGRLLSRAQHLREHARSVINAAGGLQPPHRVVHPALGAIADARGRSRLERAPALRLHREGFIGHHAVVLGRLVQDREHALVVGRADLVLAEAVVYRGLPHAADRVVALGLVGELVPGAELVELGPRVGCGLLRALLVGLALRRLAALADLVERAVDLLEVLFELAGGGRVLLVELVPVWLLGDQRRELLLLVLAELDVGVAGLLGLRAALVDGLGDLDHLAHAVVERLLALIASERLVEAGLDFGAVSLELVPGRGRLPRCPFGAVPLVWFFSVWIGIVGAFADPLGRLIFGCAVIVVGGGCRTFRGLRNGVPFFRPAIGNSPLLFEQAGVRGAVAGVAPVVAFDFAGLEDRLRLAGRDEAPRHVALARRLRDFLRESLARLVQAFRRHGWRSAGRRGGNCRGGCRARPGSRRGRAGAPPIRPGARQRAAGRAAR